MEKTLEQAKQEVKNEYLFFSDAIRKVMSDFSSRSQEIIFSRYGVFNSRALTLEEIGKKYHITRERVRQVIHEVLKKIRENNDNPAFLKAQENIIFAISSNDGIMDEKKLLFRLGKNNANEKAAANFFLECMNGIICSEKKGEMKFSYALSDFDFEEWRKMIDATLAILKLQKKPLLLDKLFELLNKDQDNNLPKEKFSHYLEIAEEIKKNAFGKWGIAGWKEISPKGTRGKAYLVLKEAGKPLHFREIAKRIDQYHLNKKKTHPQTVHNELIKDKEFILVGRGIYALLEWGYKKGTVKEVIEEILKNNEHSLNREKVISKVLEMRYVKKSTIVINLNNYFLKAKNGTYSIKK